jgi:hypothetical protein
MDLTKQPPRRPSNQTMGGLVGLARMADKARAHNEETLGEFKYGADSGLDREVLEFINVSAEDFARAAPRMSDEELGKLALDKAQKSQAQIEAFNREHLERLPQDELHERLLKERIAKYAPGRTDIKTVFQSIELDDWGAFRDVDLTRRPPRTPHARQVAGVVGAARMADKARAARCGKLGEYKYGTDSGLDSRILEFLGISAGDFQEGAYANPNDIELSDWVRERCQRTPAEICAFNASRTRFGKYGEARERLRQRRQQLCPERGDIETIFDLLDYDDEKSFGLVDLTRHAPRSPYDTTVGGLAGLARLIDKGRAYNSATLGEYWFGNDSGFDRRLMGFLGITQEEFSGALKQNDTDEKVMAWLGQRLSGKSEAEIAAFNQRAWTAGPQNEAQWNFVHSTVAKFDPARRDIQCFAAVMALDDAISFARLKAGV